MSTQENKENQIDEKISYDDLQDEADIASAIEMDFLAKSLADHRNKVAPEKHPDFDGVHCIDCGVEIPEARLKLFKIRCFDCQNELEKKNKQFGRR
jgi:RNA polymerase-binding transcription factor DksA